MWTFGIHAPYKLDLFNYDYNFDLIVFNFFLNDVIIYSSFSTYIIRFDHEKEY
jgi:hypothetical protein